MDREYLKTHNYQIVKTYTPDEIKAHGDKEYFYDKKVTKKRIKLRRAQILNKIGYQCVEDNCNLKDFHFGLGIDKGGGLHLDLYGYDQEGDIVMITIDHIVPKSKGGSDTIDNFQPMCKVHNEMKAHEYNMDRQFKDLCLIYPKEPMISQNYEIGRHVLTQEEIDGYLSFGGFLADNYGQYLVAGEEHMQLVKRGEGVMMSTHQTETMTNQEFINQAFGDVIIFGLGLGMIVFPLLNDEYIKSITIIEKDRGVIDMVGKIVKEHDHLNKVHIFEGDAFTYHEKIKKRKFDTIYFDIWIRIDEDAFIEMERLHGMYRKFMKNPSTGYLTSWCYDLKKIYFEQNAT